MANIVQFARGLRAKYDSYTELERKRKIFFAQDTKEILVNGISYWGDAKIKDVVVQDGVLTILYVDGTTKDIELPKGLIAFKIVDELPTVGNPSTIYFVRTGATEGDDLYLEYVYLDGRFELMGTTAPADNNVLQSILQNTKRIDSLEPRVDLVEERLDVLEGDSEGSVKNTADSVVDDAMEWLSL